MQTIVLQGTTTALGALTITGTETYTGFIEKVIMDYDDGATATAASALILFR